MINKLVESGIGIEDSDTDEKVKNGRLSSPFTSQASPVVHYPRNSGSFLADTKKVTNIRKILKKVR